MGDSKTIPELLAESDEFERCPDCGRYLARTSNHRCRTDETGRREPDRDERRRRARADTRRADTLVGVFGRNTTTSYAYHDLANGKPRCGCHHQAELDELEAVTLARAKDQGRSPCGRCRRLR